MAKAAIRLGRANIGLLLGNMTFDFCKTIADGIAVSTVNVTMAEMGVGVYVLDNPDVKGDTIFSICKTTDNTVEAQGIFSLADGDLARESTLKGGGANQGTLKVQLPDLTPLPDVSIQVFNSDQTVLICGGVTNAAGIKVFALNNGTYKVRLYKAGVTFTIPETIVVAGDGVFPLTGAAVQIGQPASVNTCRVYEWCYMPDDSTPKASITAKANIIDLPYNYNNKLHAGETIAGIYDPITGKAYWDIVYGAKVSFRIAEMGMDITKVIPAVPSKRLSDII